MKMKSILLVLSLMAMILFPTPYANAITIGFDEVTGYPITSDGYHAFNGPYDESDFRFSGWHFGSWISSNTNYAGSAALWNSNENETTSLTRVDGGSFSLDSIDLSALLSSSTGATVTFIGQLTGSSSTATITTPRLSFGFQTFDFGSTFADVTSVSWDQTSSYHQFDNVNVTAHSSPVPEPSMMLLLFSGLAGLACYGRKRNNV